MIAENLAFEKNNIMGEKFKAMPNVKINVVELQRFAC